MRLPLLAALLIAGTSALFVEAAPAEACGGFFCQNVPVDQTGEQILFAVEGDQVEAHVQIQYQGAAEDFSWVVPVPSLPEIGVSSSTVFARLAASAGIRFQLEWDTVNGCYPWMMEGDFGAGGGDPSAGGGPPTDGGVTVVLQSQVGPYDYTILQATSLTPLLTWLGDNDYNVPAEAGALMEPYVLMGDSMHFVAFKLQKEREVGDIQPVTLRYLDDQPMIPIQLTAIATQPDLGVTVNILGQTRSVPENFLSVSINEARVNWLQSGSNYSELINEAMDEAGGQGFATEFAGPTGAASMFADLFFSEGRYDTATLASLTDPVAFFDAMQAQGFAGDTQLLNLLGRFIPLPAELAAMGVEPRDFYNNLSGYASYLEGQPFDAPAFANELELVIVGPLRHAQELFDRNPYFTRLYTSLSAEEMTVDPVFAFNSELGDVDNVHRATGLMLCTDANAGGSNAPVTITLADGRQLLTTMYGDRTALDALPAAYDIAETGASGAPVSVGRADGRSPAAELAAANAAAAALFPDRTFTLNAGTDPTVATPVVPSGRPTERNLSNGGCSTGGTAAANAFGILLFALAILRRRKHATHLSE